MCAAFAVSYIRSLLRRLRCLGLDYLSLKLNPDSNNATITLAGFLTTVKTYKPGAFPGHSHAVRQLEFTTCYLIHALSQVLSQSQGVFVEALKQLGAFLPRFRIRRRVRCRSMTFSSSLILGWRRLSMRFAASRARLSSANMK